MALLDIVVGLDGSDDSVDALRWAAGLAEQTGASTRAIGTWRMPLMTLASSDVGRIATPQSMADHCAAQLSIAVGKADIDGEIVQEVREGHAGRVLVDEAETADLVVVGRTGTGRRRGAARLAEIVLGSTARYCVHNANGPVAAVPSGRQWRANATVVVGIDGSPNSHAALAWVLENLPEECVVHAVRTVPRYVEGPWGFDQNLLDQTLSEAGGDLEDSVAGVLADLGHMAATRHVEQVVLVEDVRHGLVDPGFDVDLFVVGARGSGGLASRVLGSTADHAVRHASCPVIVIPPPDDMSE